MIPPTLATAAVPDSQMTFLDHLDALRSSLVRAAVVAGVLIAVAWFFSDRLLDGLIILLAPGQKVLALGPAEAFSARMTLALWTGGLLAIPYLMFEAWRFVAPGLLKDERQFALPWMVASALLLYSGIAFALELLLPTMVSMLMGFATPHVEARLALSGLLSFAVQLAAAAASCSSFRWCSVSSSGSASCQPKTLAGAWRHAIFFIALGAAIITPGDGPSMLILSAPLIVLYFISVAVASMLWKIRGKKAREERG
jgi:Sec-independent protein secretion pathway component TatC